MGILDLLKGKKPNVIIIMIDGARWDAIDKIPSFTDLKKDAVFFPQFITYAPYTIGSLYSTFSGMQGNFNGVNGYYKSYSFDWQNCLTLTQYLKENGYYTETDSPGDGVIPSQGFDKYRIHDEFKTNFADRHTEILRQIANKAPFFLFLRYGGIHVNMVRHYIKKYTDFSDEYFSNRHKNFNNYLQWAEESGEYLKIMIKKIKELGVYDSSVILIFTDHGCSTGDKIGEKAYGVYLYDYTLKCFLYLIGNSLPKGIEIKNQIRSIDVLPTILDMLHLKGKKEYRKIRGKSFLPLISGQPDDRIAYSETGGLGGPTPSPEQHNVRSIRTSKWKLIYNETNKKKELYDLEHDEHETTNLIGKNLEIEDQLWEEMEKAVKAD